jgi:hypothetical protein
MALDVYGPTRHAAIDDDGEPIVARLPGELGVIAPQCDRIWAQFYAGPHLGAADVALWRAELVSIRAAWERRRRAELIAERQITARDPAVAERILGPMLASDRILVICDELIAVCDDALNAGAGLRLMSD